MASTPCHNSATFSSLVVVRAKRKRKLKQVRPQKERGPMGGSASVSHSLLLWCTYAPSLLLLLLQWDLAAVVALCHRHRRSRNQVSE